MEIIKHVIFDTNAYRNLTKWKSCSEIDELVADLKAKEKRKRISAFFNSIVAQELLYHIADPNDASFNICLNANKALFLHSSEGKNYNAIASHELLLQKMFWNKISPKREQTYNAIAQLSYNFAKYPYNDVIGGLQNNLNKIRISVQEAEMGFAKSFLDFIRNTDPNSDDWQLFRKDPLNRRKFINYLRSSKSGQEISLAYIFVSYTSLLEEGLIEKESQNELRNKAQFLLENFPEPIALQKHVFECIINSNFNLYEKKRTNFLWDIVLMFYTGKRSVNNAELIFVTSDKKMLEAAYKHDGKNSIYTLDEYLDFLNN